jgi:flagellar hook-associated protein 2
VTDGRVTLTDSAAGDSALALTLTLARSSGGSVSLGTFSTAHGTVGRSRVITDGTDALVRVDGQLVRSATNTVTGAIAGTTINVLAAEPGALTTVQVTRDADAMVKTLQDFAAAYNALRSWASTNAAPGGALANNSALRTMAGSLTAQLLQPIAGVAGALTSASLAGLQHDRNGVLSLDVAVFKAALSTDLDGVRALFSQTGTATDAAVEFITGGDTTAPTASGYAVEITQAATQAELTGAAFATYTTTGTPDTITLTDASTGRSAEVLLADGDDLTTIVQRMNSAFAADGLRLTAERTVDDRIRLVSTDFGTEGGFTIAYTAGDGGDGTALLGLAAGAHAGLDVAGTINGTAGTGKGQMLTGASGDASAGLVVRYTGDTARAAGTVRFSLGVGGTLARVAQTLAADSSGAALQMTTTASQADALDPRLDDIQKRLDARRDALVRQFVAMEGALAKSQALSSALLSQLNAFNYNSDGR